MLANKLIDTSINGGGGGGGTYVDDVFSTYLYTGNGSTQTINNGIALGSGFIEQLVNASITSLSGGSLCPIAVNGDNILVSIAGGDARYSTNGGNSFTTNTTAPNFKSLIWFAGGNRWVGAGVGGLYESITPASSFNNRYSMSDATVLKEFGGYLYATKGGSTTVPAILRSNDAVNWTIVHNPGGNYFYGNDMAHNGSVFVAVGYDASSYNQPQALYSSDGMTWASASTSGVTGVFKRLVVIGTTIYALVENLSDSTSRIYSTTSGSSWSLVNNLGSGTYDGMFSSTNSIFLTSTNVRKVSSDGGVSFTSYSSLYRYSYVVGAYVWTATSNGLYKADIASYVAGSGGMVWTKGRNGVSRNHWLNDSVRGVANGLNSNTTSAQSARNISSFNANGYTTNPDFEYNANGETFVSWTFRRAPKFFDVVTYTGDAVPGRQIAHTLGVAPGMIIIKNTNVARDWAVWHRSLADATYLKLNTAEAAITNNTFNVFGDASGQTSSVFTVGKVGAIGVNGMTNANASGETYVAYLFAHDTSTDGIIQCGSLVPSSIPFNVNLGWEPQYILVKNASAAGDWFVAGSAGSITTGGSSTGYVKANTSGAEASTTGLVSVNATGFEFRLTSGTDTYIYLAIRRPNKPPTTGTQVYNAIARTGTGIAATVTGVGFAPDLTLIKRRNLGTDYECFDRLRGADQRLITNATNAERNNTDTDQVTSFDHDGISLGTDSIFTSVNNGAGTYINHFFKRSHGVFDIVCYTGTGAGQIVNHNLGTVPELIIIKNRSSATDWPVKCPVGLTDTGVVYLNATTQNATGLWTSGDTSTTFQTRASSNIYYNQSGQNYVGYLWATKAGISKVGNFTGNGTSQNIECGFTTGARFVLIKRIDAPGDWKVFDSVRGIVAGNDSALLLNVAGSEDASYDAIDPDTTGFIVNSNLGGININAATYIFLAFA
jgi:hypothetical protein